MPKKKKLLVIGDGASATGFSRVLTSIIEHLCRRYSVHHFALSYNGPVFQPSADYTIYPNAIKGDSFGVRQLPPLVEAIKPDLVLMLNDPWFMPFHKQTFAAFKPRPPVIAYTAIDNALQDAYNYEDLDYIDRFVVFTDFGKRVVEKTFETRTTHYIPPMDVVPHGIDTTLFYMLDNKGRNASRKKARAILFADQPELNEQFIVLNANKNQERKRIDLTIEGFAKFAKGKNDVKLYLHMGMKLLHYDIPALVKKQGIENKVLYTAQQPLHPEITNEQLNIIYNACDVGINTATAEGWGLVSFEHAAAGVAQVVPDHTACTEIWEGAALMLKTEKVPTEFETDIHATTAQRVADTLETLYNDRNLLNQIAEQCYRRVTQPRYRWENIANRFATLFDEIEAGKVATLVRPQGGNFTN